ncbi:MAG: hypothetical protein ACPGSD_09705 [Flavobacteriales bacterium]
MSFLSKHFLVFICLLFSVTLTKAQISLYSFDEIIINPVGDAIVESFLKYNDEIYFEAQDQYEVAQLWKTDGTASGTIKLTDFNYFQRLRLYNHQIYDGKLYFVGNSHGSGSGDNPEIWVTQGTEATTELYYTDTNGGEFNDFYIYKDHIYFDYNHYLGVYDIINDTFNAYPNFFAPEGTFFELMGRLYFTANYNSTGRRLIHMENTIADTTFLDPNVQVLSPFHEYNGDLYHLGEEGSFKGLMIFDPTTDTFTQLIEAHHYTSLQNYNNELYFTGKNAANGAELWKTDGTTSVMVKDIEPGNDDSTPYGLGAFPFILNNDLYFSAHTSDHGREIWKTDGTESGTQLVAETINGPTPDNNFNFPNAFPASSVYFNNLLFFNAYQGLSDYQIFAIDPTNSDILRITPDSLDQNKSVHKYGRNNLIQLDTTLLMGARFSSNGYQLWKMTPGHYVNIDEFKNNQIQVFADDQKNIHISQASNNTLTFSIIDMNGRTHLNGQFNENEQITKLLSAKDR